MEIGPAVMARVARRRSARPALPEGTVRIIEKHRIGPAEFVDLDDWEAWREFWLGNLKRCALQTRVGHFNEIGGIKVPGETRVCLTSNQARRLFGNTTARSGKAKRLGCGTFACAWARKDGRAVKITSDPDDVMALLEAQDLKHVVRVDKAYRLPTSGLNVFGDRVTLYGLIGEKVLPLDQQRTEWLQRFPTAVFGRQFAKHYKAAFLTPGEGDDAFRVDADSRADTLDSVCRWDDDEDADTCMTFVGEVIDTLEGLGKRGINWSDVHEGNVGMTKAGVWKALDLGISGEQAQPTARQAPVLRGGQVRGRNVNLLALSVAVATFLGVSVFVAVRA